MNASEPYETEAATPATRLWHLLTGVAGLGIGGVGLRIVLFTGMGAVGVGVGGLLIVLCGGLCVVAGERLVRVQVGWRGLLFWCLMALVVVGVLWFLGRSVCTDDLIRDDSGHAMGCHARGTNANGVE